MLWKHFLRVWEGAGSCTHILEGHTDAINSVNIINHNGNKDKAHLLLLHANQYLLLLLAAFQFFFCFVLKGVSILLVKELYWKIIITRLECKKMSIQKHIYEVVGRMFFSFIDGKLVACGCVCLYVSYCALVPMPHIIDFILLPLIDICAVFGCRNLYLSYCFKWSNIKAMEGN